MERIKRNTKFQSGINKVSFLSEQTRIAGNLFLPENYNPESNYSAIVCITPASAINK
ncbi:MAG: hypothetical protein N4A76_15240 [Firmicutes bacterium]|jgi:hypothetical protein|nr:hypothetical protein [Bacillota bacterium]